MEKQDVLKIEFVPVFDKWAAKIVYQNEEVLPRDGFEDNELKVYSTASFTYYENENMLFLRGNNRRNDDNFIIISDINKRNIEEKVKGINDKYGVFKKWRAMKGEIYSYISFRGVINENFEGYSQVDNEMYDYGNYFKTEEQAKNCLENYIKPAFDKFWTDELKREEKI